MNENTPTQNRHYYRCHDCLATACIEAETPPDRPQCGICSGQMDYLGHVQGKQWVRINEVCTCNEVCQTATGPKCTCGCGGKYHGVGWSSVLVESARGMVIETPTDKRDKHLTIAQEYRSAVQAACDRMNQLPRWHDYIAGVWIQNRADWERCRLAQKKLSEARKGSQHASRMHKLESIAR